MRDRDALELMTRLGNSFGEDYLYFKVMEEASELAHIIAKVLARRNVLDHPGKAESPVCEGHMVEEFAQLKIYMDLFETLLPAAEVKFHQERKLRLISEKLP